MSQQQGKMSGFGIVKSVISGDSLILRGGSINGAPAPTMELTLSGIQAPRFARGRSSEDEPFAWESREYMRKKVLGLQVGFVINNSSDSGRKYGQVTLGAEILAESLIRAGWATVKQPKPLESGAPAKLTPEKEILMQLQLQAQALGLGLHSKLVNPHDHVRKVDWQPGREFYLKCKGKPLAGVVDKVRDGSTIRVELVGEGPGGGRLEHTMVVLHLAGVQAPRVPLPHDVKMNRFNARLKGDPTSTEVAPKREAWPAFAEEAQQFAEARLMQRDVHVLLQGVDKFNNMFGSIIHPKGNISVRLLQQGLAKVIKWSSFLTPDQPQLLAAQKQAQAKRLHIWKDEAAQGENPPLPADFSGHVVAVSSGDTLQLRDAEGKNHRLMLASIRCPRMGTRVSADEPHAFGAREFVRSRLIGKPVRVVYEYSRPPNKGRAEASFYVSLLSGNLNLAEHLLGAGLGSLLKHRVDEDRSRFYAVLLEAEASAIRQKKGVHGAQVPSVVDLTKRTSKKRGPDKAGDDAKEAKQEAPKPTSPRVAPAASSFLAALKKQHKVPAIVEHVFGCTRLKLYIPSHNLLVSFALSCLKSPPRGDDGRPVPLYQAGGEFINSKCLQRDVLVEVEGLDKGDNFTGSLLVEGNNMAVQLTKLGFTSLHGPSADRSKYAEELRGAQQEAKAARIGVWKDFKEEEDDDAAEGEATVNVTSGEEIKVKVTEITDAATFFVNILSDPDVKLVTEGMAAFSAKVPAEDKEWQPEKGSVCAAQFGDDETQWHRVRFDGKTSGGECRVLYMDFGNHDLIQPSAMRALTDAAVAAAKPLAKACVLAGVKGPSASSDYHEDAMNYFCDIAWDRELGAKVEMTDRSTMHLTLWIDKETPINNHMVEAGWATVVSKPDSRLKEYVKPLQEKMAAAKKAHVNIWEYGDFWDGEEEDDKRRGRGGR